MDPILSLSLSLSHTHTQTYLTESLDITETCFLRTMFTLPRNLYNISIDDITLWYMNSRNEAQTIIQALTF
jgi:penicillin-binding protein-related factor A (putative recombinase)